MMQEDSTIEQLIETIQIGLEENYEAKQEQDKNSEFLRGQIYAYVECLEILQQCRSIRERKLNYDIEKRFPLE